MTGRHYTPLGYCDKTDIENYLLTTIDSSFDSQVEDWIAASEKQVNTFLGYTTASGILREQVVDEKTYGRVDTEGNLVIFPRKIPVVSISSISLTKGTSSIDLTLTDSAGNLKYDVPTSSDHIIYPGWEYAFSGNSTLGNFMEVRSNKFFVKLSYIAGFPETPPDIRIATAMLTSDYVMRHTNKEGLEQITQGRVTKRWMQKDGRSDFYRDAMELLKPYRIASLWL